MSQTSLFACRNTRDARWQLPEPPDDHAWTLLGWRQVPAPADGGVPDDAAAVLAAALAAIARTTFPSSTEPADGGDAWSPRGRNHVRTFAGGRPAASLRAAFEGTSRAIVLLSTRDPETIVRLFDDAAYPWWMQGTFALLSDRDGPPPAIERKQVVAILDGPAASAVESLPAAIRGVVKPGVDGDVAGLLSRTPELEQGILDAIAAECQLRGLEWAVVPGDEFSARFA